LSRRDLVTPRSFIFLLATPPAQLYPLSLHDALPISVRRSGQVVMLSTSEGDLEREAALLRVLAAQGVRGAMLAPSTADIDTSRTDRKSTRLNSSHVSISYAVFCLKKKNTTTQARPKP